MRNYHQEYDWPDGRTINNAGMPGGIPSASQSPVTINININLGDIIDKLVSGKTSAREALQEMVESKQRKLLTEEDENK